MKLRYWIVAMILCFAIGIGAVVSLPKSDEYIKVDMVDINERFSNVTEKLNQDIHKSQEELVQLVSELEEQYRCHIYLKTEDTYESKINNAVRKHDILLDYYYMENDEEILSGKIAFSGQQENVARFCSNLTRRMLAVFILMFLVVMAFLAVLYVWYIRPFKKLQKFAGQVSKGNFDLPLYMGKRNYFGAFTESFDILREELKRARNSEYEANRSKKELVASLSHDIKTPVATIKAICEILQIKLQSEAEKEKLHVIERKADVIDHLIIDMFNSTLDDLEKLKITPAEELSTIIEPMFNEINHYGKIHMRSQVPECMIWVDALRLNQVIDNLINNSYKYADSDIDVDFEKIGHALQITIQDYGAGVSSEELPLIVEKFYRGENSKGKDGSGLGLYLSKTFMESMGGSLQIDGSRGFRVILRIALV